MIRIKPGVSITSITPEMSIGLQIIASVFQERNYNTTITSGSEQEAPHMKKSKHWTGDALDIRTRNVPKYDRSDLAKTIKTALGEEFDVILHNTHLHVEYDPK